MNLDILISAIESESCVFLLGPELYTLDVDGKEEPLHPYLIQQIRKGQEDNLKAYYENDELFLYFDDRFKSDSYHILKGKLADHPINGELLLQLTALPVHLYLSFSPYVNPKSTFGNLGIPLGFTFGFYHMKQRAQNELEEPTKDNPLFFDMFGSMQEAESLIFTYADLFDYIKAILGGRELIQGVKTTLQKAQYFIFLGFQFDKWYVQLMLRMIMGIGSRPPRSFVPQSGDQNQELMSMLKNEFGVTFISDQKDVKSFIGELHSRFEEKGLLRKAKDKETSLYETVREMLNNDELLRAATVLSEYFDDQEVLASRDEADGYVNQLNRLERRARKKTISEEDVQVERNKILDSLQTFSRELIS